MKFDTTHLLDYQIDHTRKLVDALYRHGSAYDFSDTGTGKTYCGASVARALNIPTIVVCPKISIPTWTRVLEFFKVKPIAVVNYQKLVRGNSPYVKIEKDNKTGHIVYKWKFGKHVGKNCLILFDEAQVCKGKHSLNAELLISARDNGHKTLMMSATAACVPQDMLALGYHLGLHSIEDFNQFCSNSGCYPDGYGGMKFDREDAEASQKFAKIHTELFDERRVARIKRSELGDRFPETQITADAYDLGGPNTEKLIRLQHLMEAELAALDERSKKYTMHIFAIIMKWRRQAELLKVPAMVEMMTNWYEEGMSPVCFINFRETANVIIKKLSKIDDKITVIRGGQKGDERQNGIIKFQNNEHRICVASIDAGGCSIDLHDTDGRFPRATLISPNWSAIKMIQALGRVCRQGGKSKSIQRIFFAANTIEERACNRTREKIENIETLNDGDLAIRAYSF